MTRDFDRTGICVLPEMLLSACWYQDVVIAVNALVLDQADAREGLQAIVPSERNGRRIIHDGVPGAKVPERPAFAVTNLHEAAVATAPDMIR